MWRQVPNFITTFPPRPGGRVFFLLLSWYQYEGRGHSTAADMGVFSSCLSPLPPILWMATSLVNGRVETVSRRVVDPFVDKFWCSQLCISFAGKISSSERYSGSHIRVAHTITGVTPAWFVVILGPANVVTSLRGLVESTGLSSARWSGQS